MIHELRQVRAFLKICETRNFTRAAADLHVSQSALTVQIQQLEESLGVQLFDGNKRGATLTAAGREVEGPLQRLFHDARAIVDHAHELSSASKGLVMVAALPTVAGGVLPELVGSFGLENPGIRLQVLDIVAERVREAVLKRQVDVGIGTTHGRDAQLSSTALFRDRLVVFVPSGHALAARSSITLREVAEYQLILPTRESSVWENMEAIARRERLTLEPRYQTNFMPTALGFVRAGLGVAILPESAAGPKAAGYARIPISDRLSSRQIAVLQPRDATLSPAAEKFVLHLRRHFRTEKSSMRGDAR